MLGSERALPVAVLARSGGQLSHRFFVQFLIRGHRGCQLADQLPARYPDFWYQGSSPGCRLSVVVGSAQSFGFSCLVCCSLQQVPSFIVPSVDRSDLNTSVVPLRLLLAELLRPGAR